MEAPGPLRVGITPWVEAPGGLAEALAAQAERAERLGLHSFWLPESHFIEPNACPAPLLLLAAAAARTRSLRIATTSYLLPVRRPLQVAEEVAVLDRLSEGRLILGVGRGFRSALFEVFEVASAEKRERFEEALAIMRAAWRGEPLRGARADGAFLRLAPLPVQRPHPPLWVAAFGPKAVAQAGRLGLPYLASPLEPLATLQDNYERHAEAAAEAGRARPTDVPVIRSVFLSRDEACLARVREALAQQAAALARAPQASLRRAAAASVDAWALVGEPEAVAEALQRYREGIGLTHLIARLAVPGAEPAEREASLELLAALAARG